MALTDVRIIGGPSKFDLMLAFFDKHQDGSRRPVEFALEVPWCSLGVLVVIYGLEWEDGSGEKWNFAGFIQKPVGLMEGLKKGKGNRVVGHFSTQTRQGWLGSAED